MLMYADDTSLKNSDTSVGIRVLDTYRSTCEIAECKACAIINK